MLVQGATRCGLAACLPVEANSVTEESLASKGNRAHALYAGDAICTNQLFAAHDSLRIAHLHLHEQLVCPDLLLVCLTCTLDGTQV